MKIEPLSESEKQFLLMLARQSIDRALQGKPRPEIDFSVLPLALQEEGASFVTLTIDGRLRGCIGSLEAHQSLAADVREHAVQAACEDYRFPPLTMEELPHVLIEISRLTHPTELKYEEPMQLTERLKPRIDGVILKDGFRRATFLPQVWDQLPSAEEFLSHLCAKMGASPDLWRRKMLQVSTYAVEEFHE